MTEAINDTCPVMDVDIDPENPPQTVEHDGKTIGFCCGSCVSKFKDNPEKYMEKLEA